mgnify:CR=1 FL=1
MDKSKISIIIFAIILVIVFICLTVVKNKLTDDYSFKIYFFNAGKADAILISNNDHYIMIDTGKEELSDEILTYFRTNNITKLDYLIITHFDKDHVGSASTVIDNIEIGNVLQSNVPKESEYYNNYITSLANKNITPITVSGDYEISIDDMNIVVNGPTEIFEKDESNNSSLITSVIYKNNSFLFTGDAENERIKDYLENHTSEYDFIKIPYHGNYLKQLSKLLETVNPNYAVITSSDEELEDDETIELLNNLKIKYYLTRKGPIVIKSNGDNIHIEQN